MPPTPNDDAIVDSGCSYHTLQDDAPVASRTVAHHTKIVGTPTGDMMKSSAQAMTKHNLPPEARKAHTYPGLTYRSLLSVGQICNTRYRVVFDDDKVQAISKTTNSVDLVGYRDPSTGLYHTPMEPSQSQLQAPNATTHIANNVYAMRTKTYLTKYLHLACWSPVTHTWCTTIKNGFFATFPGLTPQLVRTHLPDSTATTKGHMKLV